MAICVQGLTGDGLQFASSLGLEKCQCFRSCEKTANAIDTFCCLAPDRLVVPRIKDLLRKILGSL